ncbi:hypothetical protein GLV94_01945 [Virgibacillus halodenitrificans]|uniref:hypothetical protein n=1 Tax=Virgibacillus halodenitrificans TaxID=1482 RepID=UPI00136F5AAC|nr:hypothetical protein [Virgibacillus halodenitrificans]MYL44396.1 hypothetical protein [Virgibacillus halodenitrificans]
MEKDNKNKVSDIQKVAIIEAMEEGTKWGQIAEDLGLEYKLVHSVLMKEYNRKKYKEVTEGGGRILYWGGMRLTDGKPSPVKTYHISELEGRD